MGAKQSKRSVDISGTPKKGDTENGAVAVPEEKLEKISEDTVVVKANANGSTTTTSTLTAEQQEAATAATTTTETESTPTKPEKEQTPEKSEEAAVTTPTTPTEEKEEPSSPPTSPSEPTEEGSAKKTKKNKKWSFRSWSFSKKDKVKPNVKEEKVQETVPEDNEAAAAQSSEPVNPEVTNVTSVQNEEPPPLPSSPPPTPAEETPAEKEETLTTSEGDVDASGGGEGLAEPIEDAELEAAVAAPIADKIAETVQEVEAQLQAAAQPVAEPIADAVEEVAAAVAELKVSTPPPVPAVTKHVEVAEDGELKVTATSQIEAACEQPLTNGVSEKIMNGHNGN